MNSIKNKLKEFKLAGILNGLEERLSLAKQKSMAYIDFLELLLEDEERNRQSNSYKKRYNQAKLPAHKIIDDFDFSFQPSIDRQIINDLCTCHFIQEKKNVVFIGSPGTGKTHLSIAIGIKALMKNYKVHFTSVNEMLHNLNAAKADNSYFQKIEFYLKTDLLILDELGFKKLPGYSADDFFEIISKRYEKGSIIITTNKPFESWGEIFGDMIMTSAILDRIVHHCQNVKITGSSYRTKALKKNLK